MAATNQFHVAAYEPSRFWTSFQWCVDNPTTSEGRHVPLARYLPGAPAWQVMLARRLHGPCQGTYRPPLVVSVRWRPCFLAVCWLCRRRVSVRIQHRSIHCLYLSWSNISPCDSRVALWLLIT